MSDDKINAIGTNIAEKTTMIWNVTNVLFLISPCIIIVEY